jgi:hypothetical protein
MDLLVTNMEKPHVIPVWFFVGLLLAFYGVLILASGLLEWPNPPATVLSNLHAPVWWGAVLIAVGAAYAIIFRPRQH